MTAELHPLRDTDLEWAVDRLERRRATLRPFAPVLWRAADDARQRHLDHLRRAVILAGALAFRTEDSVLIATPSRGEWVLDDVAVDDWDGDGELLWEALLHSAHGERLRMVCPVAEPERLAFARSKGLALVDSWWHREVETDQPATTMAATMVADARAHVTFPPPVYNPGGPVFFLTDPSDEALAAAPDVAAELGCPLVVVSATTPETNERLAAAGFVHHADFCEGVAG